MSKGEDGKYVSALPPADLSESSIFPIACVVRDPEVVRPVKRKNYFSAHASDGSHPTRKKLKIRR